MDYINPMQMYQNVNSAPNNPFWSGYQGGQFQQQAQPFIDMMRQGAGYDLQKKAMETGEFMGSTAQAQREAERQAATAKSQYTIATEPERAQTDITGFQQTRRKMPDLTDAEIAKARQTVMNAQSAPAREFIAEAGALADHFDNLDEGQRQQAYDQFINRWHMTHPGAVLPEHLRKYSPELHREMKAIHYASVNTPEQIGRERLKDMEVTGGLQRETLQQAGATDRALIQGQSQRAVASIHANTAETPQKAEARIRRQLRDNPNDEDAQRELRGYIEDRFDQRFQRDGLGQMLQVQAASDPKNLTRYLTYREQQKARLFMNEGIYGDVDGEGRSAVLRAIELNPNMGVDNIVNNLRKYRRKDGKNGLGGK